MARGRRGGRTARRGSAAVEFAIVGPLFILLLVGMVVYGGWFWMAQSVQHMAAEAARAAVGGLDDDERQMLAQQSVQTPGSLGPGMKADHLTVTVTTNANQLRAEVAYDAAGHPLMALAGLVPAPPTDIRRTAVVRVGGY